MTPIINKLEQKIITSNNSKKQINYIHFEKNELTHGLNWIDVLLQFLKNRKTISITYQSFKKNNPSTKIYTPYLLKEYRNRWFLLCKANNSRDLAILALDRIKDVQESKVKYEMISGFDADVFFDDCIGVSKSLNQKTIKVILSFDQYTAPYVVTKPLHSSQTILKEDENQMIISIDVIHNFELEREILGFGASVKVLSPRILSKRITDILIKSHEQYQDN
jgi:predicted DNA-binding transcriptional regulator YafY